MTDERKGGSEGNTLGRRLRRYANVTASVGGAAAKIAPSGSVTSCWQYPP